MKTPEELLLEDLHTDFVLCFFNFRLTGIYSSDLIETLMDAFPKNERTRVAFICTNGVFIDEQINYIKD